jgi:hypothetical protein
MHVLVVALPVTGNHIPLTYPCCCTHCDVPQVCKLTYSKNTSNPARWVLAVQESSPVRTAEDLAGCIVASELVNTTKK